MRKKIMIAAILLATAVTGASAQDIYKEVQNIMHRQETIKQDAAKPMEERKIATFKWDAIYYLSMKAGETERFTAYELGQQTSAMLDFVNQYVKRLASEKKKDKKAMVMSRYRGASVNNSLFNDMDKDIVYAYVDNEKFLTQFSLDTDWIKALEEVRQNGW